MSVQDSTGSQPETEPTQTKRPQKSVSSAMSPSHSGGTGSRSKSNLTQTSSKLSASKSSSRRMRDSKRRVAVEKAIAAWGMDTDKTLGGKLTTGHLAELYDMFKNVGRKFTKEEFKKMLESINIRLEDDVFEMTFLKMDTSLDGDVSWDEVISFLLIDLLESQDISEPQEDMLKPPISSAPESFNSHHRYPIVRMTFIPEVNRDRSASYSIGKFATASKDGTINFWSLNMMHEKSVSSNSALLKVQPTWVTDMVSMPDISIIATSSTERELRFYDTTANKWDLRVLIWAVDKPVMKMHYYFSQNQSDDSCLIMGDTGGTIRVLLFNPFRRGPFREAIGSSVTSIQFADVLKGKLPGLRVVEFLNIHNDWVRQVSYHPKSNSFISCSTCPKTSVFMCDVFGTKSHYRYSVPSGITCFSVAEETHTLVTGGPDCNVRVWNLFVPDKPVFTLVGHHATIVSIILQALGRRVYSMDMSRCIRVWDCTNQTCIQTYTKIMAPIEVPFATFYQTHTRTWMVAAKEVVVLHCCPKLFDDRTDGFTHTKPVTVVLYNSLFKCVITAGIDSSIMVWDLWRGRRSLLIRKAHSRIVYGKQEGVEITAACFDPPQQQLLTGARNGTLKVWNFNTGNCVRNMTVGASVEITAVMWIPTRIMATSWNKVIVEFVDSGASLYGKQWETRHTKDIMAAAAKAPECLASASSNGELIFWRLETGQPYARYNVSQPTHKSGMMHYVEEPVLPPRHWLRVKLPASLAEDRPPAIHCLQFLPARVVSRGVGSLLVSLSTGRIQVWSHHQVGGFLTDFLAVHTFSDYVACMATDPDCNYLFTGHAAGYIKIWLLSNFCYPGGPTVNIFRPALRKEFPFLNSDRILGRAKRAVRNQPLPMLLSSLRGHLKPVSCIEYLPGNKMVLTGSADHTVRIWTLAGEYIATLGTFRPWITLSPDVLWDSSAAPLMPADLKRCSSFTTMKVLRRGYVEWTINLPKTNETLSVPGTGTYRELTTEELVRGTYGQRLYKPFLGRCFKLPHRALPKLPRIKLDTSLRNIEVYSHIILSQEESVEKPVTPPLVQQRLDISLVKKKGRSDTVMSQDLISQSTIETVISPTYEATRHERKEEKTTDETKSSKSSLETTKVSLMNSSTVHTSPTKKASSRKVSILDTKGESKHEMSGGGKS